MSIRVFCRVLATLVGGLVWTAHFAQAQSRSMQLCGQTVNYERSGPLPSDINGVWKGTIEIVGGGEGCLGFVVEGFYADGSIKAKFVWNAADAAQIRNGGSRLGVTPWRLEKEADGRYHMRAKNAHYDLTLTKPGHLEGTCTTPRYFIMRAYFDRDDTASALVASLNMQ
jgi:hypothetical protein